jgi:AcrR family transcriptional regulator
MDLKVSRERKYRSSLREEHARETRVKIRKAARALFTRDGFGATTVAAIAREAGVSAPTVYAAFESKAGIVSAMLEEMEEGAATGDALAAVFAEPDPRAQLRRFVGAHCGLFRHSADVLRAAVQAIGDPGVAALAERGDGHRRSVIDALVRNWETRGALRPGLAAEGAAERLWLLTTVESYLTAVDRLGWEPARYEAWLGEVSEREMLGEGEERGSSE